MPSKIQEDMSSLVCADLVQRNCALNPSSMEFIPHKWNVDAPEFIPSKKFKNDELNSSTSDLLMKNDTEPEEIVLNTPLEMYLKVNLDRHGLYREFTHHLLTREQLKMFGFPEEAPGRPGRAIMRTQGHFTKWSSDRRCVRCRRTFTILPNGQYVSDSFCRYHAKKFMKNTPYHGDYPCCKGSLTSEGCMTWKYHVTAESALHDIEFVQTKGKKHLNEITAETVYALDCEMVYTTAGMEVVKVGLVGVDGLTVFESFVLPQNQILDYNTAYSGVSEKDLKGVSMTLQDVQSYMLKLLNKESILVGHGLENDLKALRLIHYNIVDTSVTFPRKNNKYKKQSLKSITQDILHKDIQISSNGHNCIEDARTCMQLMLHKIHSELEAKNCVIEDEKKNAILQDIFLPADLSTSMYAENQPAWSNTSHFDYNSNSRYATDYSMPASYFLYG